MRRATRPSARVSSFAAPSSTPRSSHARRAPAGTSPHRDSAPRSVTCSLGRIRRPCTRGRWRVTTIWELDEGEREIEGIRADGTPDPAYAAALGILPAPYGRRALAVAIDIAIYALVQLPYALGTLPLVLLFLRAEVSAYGFLTHPQFLLAMIMAGVTAVLTLALAVVQLVLHGRRGFTIGKASVGVRTIHVATLERPGFWRVVWRVVLVGAAGLVPVAGYVVMFLSVMWDPERRGRAWHDRASSVWLIDVRRGLQPYDDKRMRIARKMVRVEAAPEAPELPSLATHSGAPEAYRPAGRVSAGVLGVARAGRGAEGAVGLAARPPRQADPQAPAIVLGMPADLTSAPPAAPAPRAPEPAPRVDPAPRADPAPRPAEPAPRVDPAPRAEPAPRPAEPEPDPLPADPAPAAPAFRLVLDTGGALALAGPILVGRDPQGDGGFAGARPVAIPDDTRSISKTHVALAPRADGVEIRDLGSTNGTSIRRGEAERPVPAGTSVLVRPGDVVAFGDRTIRIERA
nr:RDD family protein [Microbacterium sp. ZXX196]